MNLLHPIFLWGLLALLIPLLIHLWHKRENKVVWVGSTKWLENSEEQQSIRFQFRDVFLFLLRALLIALTVFLLTEPFWKNSETFTKKTQSIWVLDAKLLEKEENKGFIQKLLENKSSIDTIDFKSPLDYWTYIKKRAFTEQIVDSLHFIGQNKKSKFGKMPKQLPFYVNWVFVPNSQSNKLNLKNKSLIAEEDILRFENGTSSEQIIHTLRDTLYYSNQLKQYSPESNNFQAAIQAIEKLSSVAMVEQKQSNTQTDWLITSERQDTLTSYKQLILEQNESTVLDNRQIAQQIYSISTNFKNADLSHTFPYELANVLLEDTTLNRLMASADLRALEAAQLHPIVKKNKKLKTVQTKTHTYSFSPYIWLLVCLLFLIERLWVYFLQK